jgi:hypothetical protein
VKQWHLCIWIPSPYASTDHVVGAYQYRPNRLLCCKNVSYLRDLIFFVSLYLRPWINRVYKFGIESFSYHRFLSPSVAYFCCLEALDGDVICFKVTISQSMLVSTEKGGLQTVSRKTPKKRDHLQDTGEDKFKMYLNETGREYVNWFQLSEVWVQWRALVNTVMNIRVLLKAENILISRTSINFSKRILLHGVLVSSIFGFPNTSRHGPTAY